MAYNKSKYLEAAQKFLAQGKIAQAIGEYQHILKNEPKDQVTLMTVGDLYVRLGETFQALEYFERLAQLYITDGFTTKAIAIYKKVAKLAPEETRPLEKLAELYVQQGVLSEARPLYLQLAEQHMRGGRQQHAVKLFRRLLDAEPDNLRVQLRLADLHQALGQPTEASGILLDAAKRVFERGDHAEAESLADRALKADERNNKAALLKARVAAGAGRNADALELLGKRSGAEEDDETAALLIELHLQSGAARRAADVALRVLARDPKKYAPALEVANSLTASGEIEAAFDLADRLRPALAESEPEKLGQLLQDLSGRMPDRIELHEWLVELYTRANDTFRLPEALAHLAEALESAGQNERALETWERILEHNAEDNSARRRVAELSAKLGRAPVESATVDEAPPAEAPPPEAAKPAYVEPPLEPDTQRFVSQALTDVDLFSSYGLMPKAVDLLERVLQRAPRHTGALEKLLDLSLGTGEERRTAELAARLEQIYTDRGDTQNAERFNELRRRFQRAAGLTTEELAAATAQAEAAQELAVPEVEATPVAGDEPSEEAAVHEVDLSEEWAALAQQVEEAAAEPVAARPEEPQAKAPRAEYLEELAAELEDITAESAAEEEPAAAFPAAHAHEAAPPAEHRIELSAAHEEFKEREPFTPPPPPPIHAPVARVTPGTNGTPEPLREVFDEFRAELGDMAVKEEDLETHHNLGIAYREMGLLEEAIGEFQRVAKAVQEGRPFRYAMQCCTLLGLSFMEKGLPNIAALWYERALQTPNLEPESILALWYDLGIAQELAGDEEAALKSFSQVYAMNIDYRDVAERIASLARRS